MTEILHALFDLGTALFGLVIFAVVVSMFAGFFRRLADNYRENTSGTHQTPGDSLGPRPVTGPTQQMTAAQNAYQNTHGATARNAAQNSGQNI